MRFPVPSSLKASGSSFCTEIALCLNFLEKITPIKLQNSNLNFGRCPPFQSQSEVHIVLQHHSLQPVMRNTITINLSFFQLIKTLFINSFLTKKWSPTNLKTFNHQVPPTIPQNTFLNVGIETKFGHDKFIFKPVSHPQVQQSSLTCSSSAVSISSPVRSSILWLIFSTTGSSYAVSQALKRTMERKTTQKESAKKLKNLYICTWR